ncbi:MAG: 4Fe-4S binding protein, partial [Syntrophales bacterium]|nr:4Fe-4S binding protein [Syntrophales bacterium]
DAGEVSRLFNVSLDKNKFFIERHPKLDPLSTMTEGVFLAGTCQGPKDIPDTVAQAMGAAAEALTIVGKEQLELEAATAFVNPSECCGCHNCVRICPYSAPSFNSEKGVSEINEALCKGCGLCAATCPAGAITTRHFTNDQIMGELEGLMEL